MITSKKTNTLLSLSGYFLLLNLLIACSAIKPGSSETIESGIRASTDHNEIKGSINKKISKSAADVPRPSRDEIYKTLVDPTYNPDYVLLARHRSLWSAGVCEDSWTAIKNCIASDPADMAELDIKVTKDTVAYILHDNYLQRTTNFCDVFPGQGKGRDDYGHFDNYTWDEIKSLILKDERGAYLDEGLPLFEDVITYYKDNNINQMIQLDISNELAFKTAWDIIKRLDAFDVVIFKGGRKVSELINDTYFNGLTEAQKQKVVYFPYVLATAKPSDTTKYPNTPMGFYQEWDAFDDQYPDYNVPGGYEATYKTLEPAPNVTVQDLIDISLAIKQKNKRRIGVFAAQPVVYRGNYRGDRNILQCCFDRPGYDKRGDFEFILNPSGTGYQASGINGYILTDESLSFLDYFPNRRANLQGN